MKNIALRKSVDIVRVTPSVKFTVNLASSVALAFSALTSHLEPYFRLLLI